MGKRVETELNNCTMLVPVQLIVAKDIETVQTPGDKKITELRVLGDKVTVSTSERGGKALRATLNSMEDAWNLHLATVGDVQRNLSGAMTQWSQFEQQLDSHAVWCRGMESFFK